MYLDIVKNILKTPQSAGEKLPSVRLLAESLKISPATAHKVLKVLLARGIIYSLQGKGFFWGKKPDWEKLPEPHLSGLQQVEAGVREDWRSGYYDPQKKLPSIKEMAARYNVSRATVQKYFEQMQAQGIVDRVGQGRYFPVVGKDSDFNKTQVILITRCDAFGTLFLESDREIELLKEAYRVAEEQNLELIILGYEEQRERFLNRYGKECKLSDFPLCLGSLVSTWLLTRPRNLLHILAAQTYPVSVWWEHPVEALPRSLRNKEKWAFFNLAFGTFSGNAVGKYLLAKGYIKVAFISPYHESNWSKDRLIGLQNSGIETIAVVDKTMPSPWAYRQEAIKSGAKGENVETVARKQIADKLLRLLNSKTVLPSVWVCVNDEVASILMELASKGKIKLPQYWIGFDNSRESYRLRLDSFEFNTSSMVRQSFYHLTAPGSGLFATKDLLELSGKIVEK